MSKPSEWSAWNDEERVEWLFHSPEWSIDSELRDLPEADATRLRGLIEQKWRGLSDVERIDLLIKGPQWMREGVRARVTPEEAAHLEELANSRWASMSDEEKIALLTAQLNIDGRETVLKQREPDTGRRQQLLQAANDRANERMRRQEEAWMRDHPEWRRRHDLDARGRIRAAAATLHWWRRIRRGKARGAETLAAPQEFPDLTPPDLSALPDVHGENLDFEWDTVGFREDGREDDLSTVIRHRGETLWTEPARWEGMNRFIEVRCLLRDRYGDRLRFLLPTPRSELYLLGDSFTASDTAISINLPDLVGERLAFTASYESDELGGPHLHIRCGDRLVYRDLSPPVWPDLWRLEHIEGLMRRRYGARFDSLSHAADADDVIYAGLPELHDEKLDFEWGFTPTGSRLFPTAVVLHGGAEIWRDTSDDAFVRKPQIESLLRARYGDRIASLTDRSDVEDVLRPPPPDRGAERGPVTGYEWSCKLCGAPAGSLSVDDAGSVHREGFAIWGLTDPLKFRLSKTDADSLRHALGRGDAAAAFAIDYQLTPWWCPECRESYCHEHSNVKSRRWWDPDSPTDGTCPQGHARKLHD
jgi:hypothetical protein